MRHTYNLADILLNASISTSWADAVNEWHVAGCHDNHDCSEICLCGHDGIRYEFTIENSLNGNRLSPIGSRCILNFGNVELKNEIKVWEEAIKLLDALRKEGPNTLKNLDSKYFSRKLFTFLYEKKAFTDNKYNHFNSVNDYKYMIKMFNMRNEPTKKQKAKIYMILQNQIFPWLNNFEKELTTKDI